jgi:hypothetical protein
MIARTTLGADIPQAIVASMTAVKFHTDVAELNVQLIMKDNYFVGRYRIKFCNGGNWATGQVHESRAFHKQQATASSGFGLGN